MHYSFPALNIHTQCSTVDLGMESHIDASPIDRPPSVTGHTAPPPPPWGGECGSGGLRYGTLSSIEP